MNVNKKLRKIQRELAEIDVKQKMRKNCGSNLMPIVQN